MTGNRLWLAGLLAGLATCGAGCGSIRPPIDADGRAHQYRDRGEVLRNVDHYYGLLRGERETFRTNVPSFDRLTLYCDYLRTLIRQARQRFSPGLEFDRYAIQAVQMVLLVRSLARGFGDDQDQVPGLIDVWGRRIQELTRVG